MSAPITLYSPDGKRTRQIAAIDAVGWIKAGWLKEPQSSPHGVLHVADFAPSLDLLSETQSEEPIPQVLAATPKVSKAKQNDVSRDGIPEIHPG